ncbi:MAG: 6-phosphofructokinase, partial [Bacteroidota bacterium]
MKPNKKIGVFTSGGDSPGMNAAIRAVVRSAVFNNFEVIGIRRGFEGMIDGDFIEMKSESVSNIIQRGGTILKTARSKRFITPEGMSMAAESLRKHNIDGLVALGGDGTFRGCFEFRMRENISSIGVPCTIDNDLYGTDFTIGYDTAINTAMEAIDKIRDTADSHNRLFFIEVMGRDAGFIALRSGIGGGAEAILVPETKTDIPHLISILEKGWKRNKSSSIVVVAEGDEAGGAYSIAKKVKEHFDYYDTRVSILGHMQRGGNPTCMDRVLASRLGVAAVEALIDGKENVMVGVNHRDIEYT